MRRDGLSRTDIAVGVAVVHTRDSATACALGSQDVRCWRSMAGPLVACPDCSNHVLSSESACPHCGATLRDGKGQQLLGRTATAVLMGLTLAGCPASDDTEETTLGGSAGSSSTTNTSNPGSTTMQDGTSSTSANGSTFADVSGVQSAYGSPDTETFGGSDNTESDTTSSGGDTDTEGSSSGSGSSGDTGSTSISPDYGTPPTDE